MTGDFDTVVSSISELSSAQQSSYKGKVREVNEKPATAPDLPSVSTDGSKANRFLHVRCHYCGDLRNIARMCLKKKTDKDEGSAASTATAGNAQGDQKPPKM